MVDDSVRLHLGCGVVYRPGYVNIDTGDASVSDLRADAMDLPYPKNSVSLIEAHHLIEHFDHVHVLYLLAYWYRILEPGGELILETPDMERAFSEYRKADPKRKLTLLQWVYGVESGGMQHRTGFDLESLGDTLVRTGFIHPMSHPQQTHQYEDGIRVECRKPDEISADDEFFAEFRTLLFKAMPQVHDSMELLPLEQFCISGVRDELENGKDLLTLLSSLAVCNPEIALIFLECATDNEFRSTFEELRDESRGEWVRKVLIHLGDISFHQRLFTLWGLSRKRPGRSGEDLVTFRKDKVALVRRLIGSSIGDPGILEKDLRYIGTLHPAQIQCFHPQVVQHQARTLLNRGIKEFSLSNHETARQHFNSSVAHDRSMFPVILTFLTMMLLFPLLLPAASCLMLNSDTENNKSGFRGQEVTHNISVTNDRIYPTDIKAEISGSTWNSTIENDEFLWVLPGENIRFTVSIRIPEKPNCSHSITDIDLFERPSTDGRTGYSIEIFHEINTTLSEPDPHRTETSNWKRFSRMDGEYFIPILVVLVILPCVFIFRRNHSKH